jgi:hypothetical protein
MSLTDRLSRVRDHAHCHRYRDLDIELRALEAELLVIERDLAYCRVFVPGRVFVPASITVTPEENSVSNTYPLGSSPKFTAAVANAEGAALPGTPVSWTSTAGTISADPNNPAVATLANAPLGDVTVTATTENGVSGSDTVTIVDNTPASVTVTDSAS